MSHPDDDLERLLRHGVESLPPPAGAYERIRRAARHRRHVRAAVFTGVAMVLLGMAIPLGMSVLSETDAVYVAPLATTPPQPSAPRCGSSDLHVSLGRVEGAAGGRYAPLVFTNNADHVCHLQGYPGVSLLDSRQHQIRRPAVYAVGNPHVLLQLRPGGKVSTTLHWTSLVAGRCAPESSYLRVYPPGDTDPIIIRARIQLCGDVFDVRNLVDGSSGVAG